MKVSYYINGQDFAALGVRVSGSKGLLDGLKMREPRKMTWPDHHGEVVDLASPRYEPREITLECFIKASTPTAFILAVQTFLAAFQKAGLQQLMIDVNDAVATRKPLLYQVFLQDQTVITKKWNAAKMIGTFTLKLREPEPVKAIYKFVAVAGALTVSMEITTTEPVNIYWGPQGEVSYDVTSESEQIDHMYASAGTYYIVITGVIEDIEDITTTATEIWSRL